MAIITDILQQPATHQRRFLEAVAAVTPQADPLRSAAFHNYLPATTMRLKLDAAQKSLADGHRRWE